MTRKNSLVVIKVKQFICIFILLLFSQCCLYDYTESIEIFLPDSSVAILEGEQFHWVLEYCLSSGKRESLKLDNRIEKVTIDVPKGFCTPLLLYAVININGDKELVLYPAGFISSAPWNIADDMCFQWKKGFESSLLNTLSQYINLDYINIDKLFQSLSSRADDENLWIINSAVLIENLISGDFNIYDIRKFRERDIEINVPEGNWFNTNLLGANIISSSELISVSVCLYTGLHRFFNKNGFILEIEILENGDFDFIIYK